MTCFNSKLYGPLSPKVQFADSGLSPVPRMKFVKPETGDLSRGRILVMDDEELIRDTLGRMITGLGYDVTLTANGEEAVSLYKDAREKGEPYNCVILDLTITGGMGARDVIGILKEYDSSVTAIISSGYPDDPVVSDFRQYGFAGVSVKPYTFDQLRTILDTVITGN